jgi:uncharacterized protein
MTEGLWLAALTTGLAGSLHCAAMCGPVACAAAGDRGRRGAAEYAAGRLLGYAAMGALFGLVGQHALCRLPIDRISAWLGWALAGTALWMAAKRLRPPRLTSIGRRRVPLAARVLARLPRRPVAFGLATALLPCGMLLPAWGQAALGGSAAAGAAVMVIFALASLPGLLSPLLLAPLGRRLMAGRPWVVSVLWGGLAVWLAIRQLPVFAAMHHH